MNDEQVDQATRLNDCLDFVITYITDGTPKYQREVIRCAEVALHILKQMKDELEGQNQHG